MFSSAVLERVSAHIARLKRAHPLRIGIDGIDGAGKTTLANALADDLRTTMPESPVIRASIDGFHQPRAIRHQRGSLSPEGYYLDSFDYPALRSQLLGPLGPHGSRHYRTSVFDFRTDTPISSEAAHADAQAILIFDGVFLQRPELADLWDSVIFVDIPFEVSLQRALTRDLALFGSEAVIRERYQQRYIPGQRLYFAQCQPRERADLVIEN